MRTKQMIRLPLLLVALMFAAVSSAAVLLGQAEQALSASPQCTIVGTPGNDNITGTSGADFICGEGGDDVINGGEGDDTIDGARGPTTSTAPGASTTASSTPTAAPR